ncbi:polyribonucleotide nucleotidyltransferase [bacterium]|nr:polyribonucleotide nucleotidyltransferase [bacterium]
MVIKKEIELGGRKLSVEIGKVARQADGAAWVQYEDTVVLATVVSRKERGDNTDFFPLSVDYREKMYAGGKIPGGFFKREARPHEKEVLVSRLIDRPIRPLFPDGYYNETQVLISVLSHDGENEGDILGALGASTALMVSDIPFLEPVASVNVGRIDGKFILNPLSSEKDQCDMHLLVSGTADAIVMVEGEAQEVDESEFLDAINFAHEPIKQLVQLQKDIAAEIGKPKREWEAFVIPEEIQNRVNELAASKVDATILIQEKAERREAQKALKDEIRETLAEEFPEQEKLIGWALEKILKKAMRARVLKDKVRLDGRGLKDIREINVEVDVLPKAHGSALFTRGQTQSLAACTLGTKMDEQKIDDLEANYWKTFMLHYNFPPFSTGEVKKFLGTGRREQGHGHLAERALKNQLPPWEEFPYTVRIVSDILESNGSSSMASVCAGSMCAMDAGVPLKASVAGIAMGLIMEGEEFAVLSDILGDEDHLGDMDFKVAGTKNGITAFQMDIKIEGLPKNIMALALDQAKEGRMHILNIMDSCIAEHKPTLAANAPRIHFMSIDPDKIGLVIGPGGKNIRQIQSEHNVNIDIDDDGTLCISSTSDESSEGAMLALKNMLQEPEVGKVYNATVQKIMDFGAFCEIFPGKEGLLHISEIDYKRINAVSDVLAVGDKVEVQLIKITPEGKLDLSHRVLLPKPEGYVEKPKPPRGGGGGGRPNRPFNKRGSNDRGGNR